jgi:hypothetical protein
MSIRKLPGGKLSRRARLTGTTPSANRISRKSGSLDISQPYESPQTVKGIVLLFYFALLFKMYLVFRKTESFREIMAHNFFKHISFRKNKSGTLTCKLNKTFSSTAVLSVWKVWVLKTVIAQKLVVEALITEHINSQ